MDKTKGKGVKERDENESQRHMAKDKGERVPELNASDHLLHGIDARVVPSIVVVSVGT